MTTTNSIRVVVSELDARAYVEHGLIVLVPLGLENDDRVAASDGHQVAARREARYERLKPRLVAH